MQNPPPPPGYPPPPPQMPSGYQQMAVASPGSYAGFWIRVVAYIIDAILLGLVGVLTVPFTATYSDPNSLNNLNSAATRTSSGIDLVLSFLYFTLLWSYMGASLGQRLLGLRVVDATTGQPIGFGKAAVRWFGVLISFFVCFIGVIWVAFDARKQGWGDKIAGTVVVRR
jgi:uncharacterized RDD family membrane protein YckC